MSYFQAFEIASIPGLTRKRRKMQPLELMPLVCEP